MFVMPNYTSMLALRKVLSDATGKEGVLGEAVRTETGDANNMELNICHLYPEVLNLYGDRGNIRCLEQRLAWRGIDCHVTMLKIGDQADLTKFDLFFVGGGQDFEQEVLLADLGSGKGEEIRAAIEDGKTFLAICGGYQMPGHYYETHEGVKCSIWARWTSTRRAPMCG